MTGFAFVAAEATRYETRNGPFTLFVLSCFPYNRLISDQILRVRSVREYRPTGSHLGLFERIAIVTCSTLSTVLKYSLRCSHVAW